MGVPSSGLEECPISTPPLPPVSSWCLRVCLEGRGRAAGHCTVWCSVLVSYAMVTSRIGDSRQLRTARPSLVMKTRIWYYVGFRTMPGAACGSTSGAGFGTKCRVFPRTYGSGTASTCGTALLPRSGTTPRAVSGTTSGTVCGGMYATRFGTRIWHHGLRCHSWSRA